MGEKQLPIEGFDYKAFAKNLADQVGPVLPQDFADADKQYIINIVYNFCYMAGEALANDTTISFNADQACIVTQFIGEWAFHKSIDVIKSGIDPQFRDGILQKIAFTVFEIAKTAIVKNMAQADMIAVVEFQVKKAYNEALEELHKKGVLNDEQVKEAQNHSNIDEMAQQAAQQETQAQEAQAAQGSQGQNAEYANKVSDNKILKLATFAIVLRHLPQERRQGLINRFSPEDAQILSDYAQMDDLENKLDKNIVEKCLKEIKNSLPSAKTFRPAKVYGQLYNIVKNSDVSKISNIIIRERHLVKNLIGELNKNTTESQIPPRIAQIISEHLEEKLSR